MDIESGFFSAPAGISEESSFELIHSSDNSHFAIYRTNAGGRYRAYKVLKPEFCNDPLYRDLLRKEYEIGCTLDHPNIRRYDGFSLPEGLGDALEMEWVDGVTLDGFIEQNRRVSGKPLDRHTAVKILDELCSALSYIHSKQIIHRDVKPSNILITHNGQNVKLIDFGFSDSDSHTLLKTPAGTLAYASPEQKAGEPLDCRSDLYSLGVIIAELLPHNFGVAAKCCRNNRSKRFQTANEVKSALRSRRRLTIFSALLVIVISSAFIILPGIRQRESGKHIPTYPAAAADTTQDTLQALPSQSRDTDQQSEVGEPETDSKSERAGINPAPAKVSVESTYRQSSSDSVSIEELFNEATQMIIEAKEN